MRKQIFYRWLMLPAGVRLIILAFVVVILPIAFVRHLVQPPLRMSAQLPLEDDLNEGHSSQNRSKQPRTQGASAASAKNPAGSRLLIEDEEPVPPQPPATREPIPSMGKESPSLNPDTSDSEEYPGLAERSVQDRAPAPTSTEPSAPQEPAKAKTSVPSQTGDEASLPSSSVLMEVPQGQLNSPVKLAHYRFILASTTYETSPDKQKDIERIAALERLTQVACMRKMLSSLSYRSPPQDPLCLEAIEKLLEINPGSTSAICARDGIDSPSCVTADSDTTTRINADKSGKENSDAASAAKFRSLNSQLSQNLNILRKKGGEVTEEQRAAARLEAKELSGKLLGLACAGSKLSVRQRPVVKVQDFSKRKDPYGLSELLEAQEQLKKAAVRANTQQLDADDTDEGTLGQQRTRPPSGFGSSAGAKPRPAAPTPRLGLVYLVSSDCSSTMSTARLLDPALPALICAERGRYSPRCIQAIRASQEAAKGSKDSADEYRVGNEDGFSRF